MAFDCIKGKKNLQQTKNPKAGCNENYFHPILLQAEVHWKASLEGKVQRTP